jgi:hypothetical protein
LFHAFADRRATAVLEPPPTVPDGSDEAPARDLPFTAQPRFHLMCLGVAAGLWLWALLATDVADIGAYGLLSALHPSFYVALGILTVGFLCGVREQTRARYLAAYLVLFVLVVHATPVLVYGTLRYAWAWKHVGVVDYYLRHHSVDPHLTFLPVYQNWPGFFGLATTFTEAAGFRGALSFAAWAPPLFELANLAAVWLIVRSLSDDRRVQWTACWFFVIANWVGQDYFSPQAFVFLLYLVVIGIALRSLSTRPPAPRFLRKLVRPLRATTMPEPTTAATTATSSTRGTVLVLCVMFAAVATSHPLTPIVLTTALIGLVVLGVLWVRILPVIMGAMTVGWLVTGAHTYFESNTTSIFKGLGSFSTNVSSNLVQLSHIDAAQRLVAQMGRVQVATVAVLAVLGFARRLVRGNWDAAAAVLLASPVVILVGGNYDGEALFRVFLFALPFAALFVAMYLYPGTDAGRRWFTTALAVVLSGFVLTGFLFAYYGKEAWSYFSPGEIRAAKVVYDHAPPRTLLVEGTTDFPNQFKDVERFTYVAIANEPESSSDAVVRQPVVRLTEWLSSPRYRAGYVIITRAQKEQEDSLGPLDRGALEHIERALLASPKFRTLYHDRDASVFTLRTPRAGTR